MNLNANFEDYYLRPDILTGIKFNILFKNPTLYMLSSNYKDNIVNRCYPSFVEALINIDEECNYINEITINPASKINIIWSDFNIKYCEPKNIIVKLCNYIWSDESICKIILSTKTNNISDSTAYLKKVDPSILSPELCKIALTYNEFNRKYIPTQFIII